MFTLGNVTNCSISNSLILPIRGSVSEREGVPAKSPSPHLTFKEPVLLLRSENMVTLSYTTSLLLLLVAEPELMLKNKGP